MYCYIYFSQIFKKKKNLYKKYSYRILIQFYSKSKKQESLLKFNLVIKIFVLEKKEFIKKYMYRILIRFYSKSERRKDLLKFNLIIKIFVNIWKKERVYKKYLYRILTRFFTRFEIFYKHCKTVSDQIWIERVSVLYLTIKFRRDIPIQQRWNYLHFMKYPNTRIN